MGSRPVSPGLRSRIPGSFALAGVTHPVGAAGVGSVADLPVGGFGACAAAPAAVRLGDRVFRRRTGWV